MGFTGKGEFTSKLGSAKGWEHCDGCSAFDGSLHAVWLVSRHRSDYCVSMLLAIEIPLPQDVCNNFSSVIP